MNFPPSHEHAMRLYGPEFADNPAGIYERMRRRHGGVAPVLLEGDVPAWLVLSYQELRQVTDNPGVFGRDPRRWNLLDQIPSPWPPGALAMWCPGSIFTEGAEHSRRHGAMSDVLEDVDRVLLTRLCERTADQLIDEFAADGKADLVTQFAHGLIIPVMASLFGFPEADARALAQDIFQMATQKPGANEAFARGYSRVESLVREQRDRPGPGIAGLLMRHPVKLTVEQAAWDLYTMLIPAQVSTSSWIGNALRLMLSDEDFSLALQGGRSSVLEALNQVLWRQTPVQNFIGRYATQDCDLGGWPIGKGDMLILGLAGANADPQAAPGAADGLESNRAHMSFSHGDHGCPRPAADMAEVMARTAIEVLLDRVPDIELAVPADSLQWRDSVWSRGLYSLPVTFTPAGLAHR